jgi:cobyrinic acid a,c-diamide synthase
VTARIVVAGTQSGVGKTTISCGLMRALSDAGHLVAPFKVGPDFIDPSYHRAACGRPGRNLDSFLSGPELIGPLFAHGAEGADIAVIEGVMGLFDGASGGGELASTAQVAKLLDAPVVLVVDAGGMARSVLALVHGYASLDADVTLAGVILNHVASDWHEQLLRDALRALDIPVVGALRRADAVHTPERHLGLIPAEERLAEAERTLHALAELVRASVDLDAIVALARAAPPLSDAPWSTGEQRGCRARVAIARGAAFSFRYEENLELLRAAGAELVEFDPLTDEALPLGTDGVYLGGGFPELHSAPLTENWSLRAEVAAFARAGRPILAECGGLLYLGARLDGRSMCGVLAADGELGDRLSLGYRDAQALVDSCAYRAGASIRGHEFHYARVEPTASSPAAWTLDAPGRADHASFMEGFVEGGVHASFLHTHWAATPGVAARFVDSASVVQRAVA